MLKKRKFLIGGAIIVLAIGYLAVIGFQRSATYYYTVSEFLAQGSSVQSVNVKLNGQVAGGSVVPGAARVLRFTMTEGGRDLPVVYQGAVPDAFKAGIEVVVEGHMDSTGTFQANAILTKCPSKYVPQQ